MLLSSALPAQATAGVGTVGTNRAAAEPIPTHRQAADYKKWLRLGACSNCRLALQRHQPVLKLISPTDNSVISSSNLTLELDIT